MNSSWEDKIKTQLAEEIHAVDFSKETQDRILNRVHGQIRKRRIGMKMNRKYTGVILAAALVVIGGITAIGAGKIAFTSGGHAVDEEVENLAELSEMAKEKLGGSVRIPENLAEGITFSSGVVNDTDAWDEEYQKLGSFPKAMAFYKDGNGKSYTLTISKPLVGIQEYAGIVTQTYQGMELSGKVDQYLFLPPDQKPSEEERQLEAEGKLFISYGSDEAEHETFTSVSWNEGSFVYLLSTFENAEVSEMMEWAKTVIDSGNE